MSWCVSVMDDWCLGVFQSASTAWGPSRPCWAWATPPGHKPRLRQPVNTAAQQPDPHPHPHPITTAPVLVRSQHNHVKAGHLQHPSQPTPHPPHPPSPSGFLTASDKLSPCRQEEERGRLRAAFGCEHCCSTPPSATLLTPLSVLIDQLVTALCTCSGAIRLEFPWRKEGCKISDGETGTQGRESMTGGRVVCRGVLVNARMDNSSALWLPSPGTEYRVAGNDGQEPDTDLSLHLLRRQPAGGQCTVVNA